MAEIKGTLKGTTGMKRVSFYASENSRIAVATLEVRFSPETAATHLGELGAKALFASWFVDAKDKTEKPLFKTTTPALVFVDHTIEVMGKKLQCIPELGAVKPVKGEHKVDVEIQLPLPASNTLKAFWGNWVTTVGTTEKAKFVKRQLEHPGMGGDGGEGQQRVIKKPGPHGSKVAKTVGGDS